MAGQDTPALRQRPFESEQPITRASVFCPPRDISALMYRIRKEDYPC